MKSAFHDTAIPCGLIINELITTVEAFPRGSAGSSVALHQQGPKTPLEVQNDGSGFRKIFGLGSKASACIWSTS
jgi:two-component sensor histidine kinase